MFSDKHVQLFGHCLLVVKRVNLTISMENCCDSFTENTLCRHFHKLWALLKLEKFQKSSFQWAEGHHCDDRSNEEGR